MDRVMLLAVLAASSVAAAAPLDGARIEQLTGAKGKLDEKEGVFKVSVPRSDLKVVAGGVHLTPPMGLTTWAAFTRPADHTMVMGDLCLTEDQVNPVMSVALDNGLEVTALHNHFFWDSPKVMFMHIGGMGDEAKLAAAVGKVFAKIKETAGGKGVVAKADIDPAKTSLDPKKIDAVLATKGELKDGVYKITIGRTTKMDGHAMGKTMGVNTWAAFAGSDDKAIVDGDFAMLESELQGVLKALRAARIDVVAIHQHMTGEQPRVMFLHYWGIGATTDLARGLAAALEKTTAAADPIELPDGAGGIGFDDMLYSPALRRVLVPAGRTGRLALIDPQTRAVATIDGFSKAAASGEGHGAGTTSADAGGGFLFASDRNLRVVDIIDPAAGKIAATVKLGGGPDYVRWVEPLGEVWVTEPNKKSIEYFRFDRAASPPTLTRLGAIEIADGPESLVVDAQRGRAYTHTWHDRSVAIDLASHRVVATWANGCKGARGIALDGARGWLFVGCDEGRATSLDVAHDGKLLGSVATAKGVDIIAWSPKASHLYVPGGDDALLSIVAVGAKGELSVAGSAKSAADAHCVATDDAGHAYVCDPKRGRILVVDDPIAPKK